MKAVPGQLVFPSPPVAPSRQVPCPYRLNVKEVNVGESILFTPARIGRLEIRNRFIRSATAERMAEPDGSPVRQMADIYRALAEGGVGLIITGHAFVEDRGRAHYRMTGIHSDNLIPKLASLARAAHDGGSRIFVQINHAGCYAPREIVGEPVAPSSVKLRPALTKPRELTSDEIGEVIEKYAQAAWRVREAGFDGVQIHAAHGYLVSQFLSPLTNKRTDKWGGNLQKRKRFLKEVCAKTRATVGDDFPVIVKLGMEDVGEGGLSLDEGVNVAANLKRWGIDGVEVSAGLAIKGSSSMRTGVNTEEDEGYFARYAARVKEKTDLPVAVVGGLRSFSVMERIVSENVADFVSLARPLIREPGLVNRFKSGDTRKAECLSCNSCWPPEADASMGCRKKT